MNKLLGLGPFEITIALLVYGFFSYCLMKIAEKSGLIDKLWWAWIPVLQILLMLKVAKVGWWWILLLLVPFLNIVIGILIWVKISKSLNKSWWWGVLMFVPGVDLFVLAYLAFSKS